MREQSIPESACCYQAAFKKPGYLAGREGAMFHFLQGFWCRFLVDAKLYEVHRYMMQYDVGAIAAIEKVRGIVVRSSSTSRVDATGGSWPRGRS